MDAADHTPEDAQACSANASPVKTGGTDAEDGAGRDGGALLTPAELEACDVLDMAKDKFKSRLLQRSLVRGGPEVAEVIFRKAEGSFAELVRDQYGNYLSQKILEVATATQFDSLFAALAPQLQTLAQDVHGTRAVQKVVEQAIGRGKVAELLEALPGDFVEQLARSVTGFHVIVKMLEALPAPEAEELLERLCGTPEKALALGADQWGCCVLKRCIDRSEGAMRQKIADAITDNTAKLIEDAFGNYVVQHLILTRPSPNVTKIIDALKGRIFELSLQKFSSNVLEKCLVNAADRDRNKIINEILNPPNVVPSEAVRMLLFHTFGNYVFQQALEVSKDPQFSLLVEHSKAHLQEVIRTANQDPAEQPSDPTMLAPEHSKRLALKLVKKYPALSEGLEAGWGQCFDPAAFGGDYAAMADYSWMAGQMAAMYPGYGFPGWDPSFAAAFGQAGAFGAQPPAKGSGKGRGGRNRSKGPRSDGKRGGRGGKQGGEGAKATPAADSMQVGRIVGFWPNYQITYDEVPASSGAGNSRGRGKRQAKSKASPKRGGGGGGASP